MHSARIKSVKAYPIRLNSTAGEFAGTAGLVGAVEGDSVYRRVKPYRPLFSKFAETVLVCVESDSGLVGWGEGQAGVAPAVVARIVETLLEPVLRGRDAADRDVRWEEMYNCMRDRGHGGGFMMDAIAAVDIALWDLCGKVYGEPVARLLGGVHQASVPLYLSGPRGKTLEERLDDAAAFVGEGFSAIKLFIGQGVAEDVAEVRAFRDRFGPGITLLVDAQWLYSPGEALKLGRQLEELGVEFLETPINSEDIAGHAELARHLRLSIALGETERTRWQILPFLRERAVDIVQPDVGRCGISEGRRIAFLAEVHNVPVAFHSGIGFGPYIAATIQLAAAIPNLLYVEYQPDMHQLARDVYGANFMIHEGRATVNTQPGLGLAPPSAALLARNAWHAAEHDGDARLSGDGLVGKGGLPDFR